MKPETPRPVLLKDYLPPPYLVASVELDVALDPTHTRVRSRLKMAPNEAFRAERAGLRLDGEQLELEEVRLDGVKLGRGDMDLVPGALVLPRAPDRPFTLELTTFVDPEANKALQGLYRTRGVYCTQCEAEGFRRITYFLDRPDVLSVYKVRMEADRDAAPVLLANGNPVERGTRDGGRRAYAVWHDPFPKPCYLFALVGGDLGCLASTFTTMSGRKVELRIYVEHGKEERAAWAMDSLKRAMRWDERRFGREYDLDVFNIVAVSDFNMGAMENKGLNIFNDRLILASPETATDTIFESVECVVGHEYFHNWTGNRITCRDWFQLCLKEGLTVYRDQEFSADERSRPVQRIADVRQLKVHQFTEDAGPLAHAVRPDRYLEISNFYTATVYEKGAEVVRMIETILGPETFRRGMDLYFARHDGQAVTVEDFVKCFEDASGRDLSQFMLWYTQAGTPHLLCSFRYDRSAQVAELKVEQVIPPTPGRPKKKPMHIPLKIGLLSANGDDLPITLHTGEVLADGVLHVTRRQQSFRFVGVPSRPVPSLLRGFSAPVSLTAPLADRDLEFLMAHDSDLFNRWQAANTYATRTLVEMVKAAARQPNPERARAYAKALGASLADSSLEPAYRAELARLPSQADIAREIGRDVDPLRIYKAHRRLARLIGKVLGPLLEELYADMADGRPFSPDAKSAGRRALRNAALSLLAARGGERDLERLADHYFRAGNMTDQAQALVLLCLEAAPARDRALADFYERWSHDHVVVDTWFSAQAQSPRNGTLAAVRALTRHPLFALTTPNKVRALLGAFAMMNPVQFNRPDGAGYEFVVDQVLALDRFNPQMAARMLGAFSNWRTLEPGRRKLARRALGRVAKATSLSRDVLDIVGRMLET